MFLLAVETSCDETAVAFLDLEKFKTATAGATALRANILASQAALHAPYGGVVPELAARTHTTNLPQLVDAALGQSGIPLDEISACCVTSGPGLKGALLVGINFAKGLAWSRGLPFIPVNHVEGHLWAGELEKRSSLEKKFTALIVSGGHTAIFQVDGFRRYQRVAETRDDAAGEAFDKIASILELPYPGGPALSRLAVDGDSERFKFPKGVTADPTSFSFSGLKTAALRLSLELRSQGLWDREQTRKDFAASVEQTIVDALLEKSVLALKVHRASQFVISGGVAANQRLRLEFSRELTRLGVELLIPRPEFCTDNAAMIAVAGALTLEAFGTEPFLTGSSQDVLPRWPLETLTHLKA